LNTKEDILKKDGNQTVEGRQTDNQNQKYKYIVCSTEERNSYRFGTKRGGE